MHWFEIEELKDMSCMDFKDILEDPETLQMIQTCVQEKS